MEDVLDIALADITKQGLLLLDKYKQSHHLECSCNLCREYVQLGISTSKALGQLGLLIRQS